MATQPAHTEQLEVRNRWTNRVQFTATIECAPDASLRIKLGLALQWAARSDNDAVLRDADLSDAVLRGADLRGADLRDADLSDAVLRGAVLRGADLRDADLRDADLSDAVLRGADLRGADLRDADLSDADLSDAVLRGADLRGADLRDADLSDAVLRGAVLRGADLRGADLRSFKADFFMTLLHGQHEVPALIAALKAGKVNGSQYEGDCACLVGTIANARGVDYRDAFPDHSSRNPAEQWFLMIKQGDKPGDDTGGGFAAEKALEWALEFCALAGIKPEMTAKPARKLRAKKVASK